MVQYQYAINTKGKIISVESLDRDQGLDKYSCLGCGKELIPHLGPQKAHHFQHKNKQKCSRETYLHKLAKEVFYNIYQSCLDKQAQFILEFTNKRYCTHYKDEFGVVCSLDDEIKEFNLTSYFSKIEIEKKDGDLIPDVKIFNPQKGYVIYIEIAVTHESEEYKKKSGNRIIEFSITDEADLRLFTSKRIALEKEKITRYNFKKSEEKSDNCNGNCKCTHKVFQVFDSGKSRLSEITLQEFKKLENQRSIIHHKIVDTDKSPYTPSSHLYVQNVIAAHENDLPVKNCFLCRYHARNRNTYIYDPNPIFCKFLKKSCSSNEAADCEYYRPDQSVYNQYNN